MPEPVSKHGSAHRPRLLDLLITLALAALAFAVFNTNLSDEPPFVDEWAYVSQSYFADLLFDGKHDSALWLEYPAYDLPPLPKYLIGVALHGAGYRIPPRAACFQWYADTSRQFGSRPLLAAARQPMVLFGVLGCVSVYALGVLAFNRGVGAIAALSLMFNPLYRMLSRRSMSDVVAESLILLTTLIALWVWRRMLAGNSGTGTWLGVVFAGVTAGLATLAKLNGALAMIIVIAWAVLAAFLPNVRWRHKLAIVLATTVMGAVSLSSFVALNPFLTAHPRAVPPPLDVMARMSLVQRARFLANHRIALSNGQMANFQHNALTTPLEKAKVIVVQGFGRFGPLGPRHSDSTRRYELAQDWGVFLWLPCVALGIVPFAKHGLVQYRAGTAPTAWAILVQAGVALAVVFAYLPLAWDRYFISLQAGSSLLAAGAAAALFSRLRGSLAAAGPAGALRRPESWVFFILLGSYAFFWHARDWNSASRLMLTYAIVDRGTVSIDGLDEQTGDKAWDKGHFYCDKLPGYSLLGCAPYLAAKHALGLPDHPLNRKGFAYWPADYWVTVAISGLLTALTGVLLTRLARTLGCGPRCALLVGIAYGLATPAYVYGTLGYGHQATAFALCAAFVLLWRVGPNRWWSRIFLAGFLAAYASVIELQVGPISAILGIFLIAQVAAHRVSPLAIGVFGLGAALPTLLLLGYNQLAFGSPWEMGYFHHATSLFRKVHSTQNPLGLRWPDVSKVWPLLWGGYRGLLFYAPILVLAIPGWVALLLRRCWALAIVSAGVVVAVFLVNLSYPEWTGGWSTGPRLLVPLLPFAMIPVAALLASGSRWATGAAFVLTLAGGILMLLFQGVGGRVPHFIGPSALVYESTERNVGSSPRLNGGAKPPDLDPLRDAVLPLWAGGPLPSWTDGRRFARNLVSLAIPGPIARLPQGAQWIQFVPLVLGQTLALAVACLAVRAKTVNGTTLRGPALGRFLRHRVEPNDKGQKEKGKGHIEDIR